ncbi:MULTISPECIES: hypothetical protein [Nostocales]|uniref:Uncharacterized protein n=3 Tax=Nostocales TaxID=1161 RepID=A0A0C1R154_9CYAN|nr:hypothetical protein [Tolypothrix bouteillei]KAF3887430.1 hypothetical protein DA73_0400019500 [Tolypothrix bouteillei VB521301]
MRIPASPQFIKFFLSVSKDEQSLFLAQIYTFFHSVEGRTSPIETHSTGERTHSSLNTIKLHSFSFDRYSRRENWDIGFYDTAIPHARIEMWDCNPPLKKDYSLTLDYSQLLIENSLADIAEGFDDTPKPFFQKLFMFFPENWFAALGTKTWVYLRFKILAIPDLHRQFSHETQPKLPFFSFGNYLCSKIEYEQQNIVKINMNKNNFKSFIEQNDTLILNTLNREEIMEWLNRLNIEFDAWFSAIAISY